MKRVCVFLSLLPWAWIGHGAVTEDPDPTDIENICVELSFAPSRSNDRDVLVVQTLSGVHLNQKVTVFTTSLTFSGTNGGMRVGGKARQSLVQSVNTPPISTDLALAIVDPNYTLPKEGGCIYAEWSVTVDGSAPFHIRSEEYSILRKGKMLTVSKSTRK